MNDQLYRAFIAEIQKIFSKNSVMIDTLAEILKIEKGAVYRRIRQEVPFTFYEIAIIAKYMNISLDSLVGIEGANIIPFQLRFPNFVSPQAEDYYTLELYIKRLRSVTQLENSEIASASNVLPHDLFIEFKNLIRFYLFIWNYHYSNGKIKPFHHISTSPKTDRLLKEYMMEMKNFSKTYFVLDNRIFRLFVDRVNYFNSIRLVEKSDVLKIKEDLLSMMDYLEKIAITGQFSETGNAVNLYISDIDITTSYTYLGANNIHFSMVKAFITSYITSYDENTFEKMKNWVQSIIKISTLITLTNEKQRVLYFEKQRKIINEL